MVGLTCAFGGGAITKPTKEPTKTVIVVPTTQEEESTATPEPTDEETPTDAPPTPEAQIYYTETFDGNLDNYTYFNTGKGNEDKMSLKTNDGYLVFDLKDNNLWIYITYNPFTYKDAVIEVTVENNGKNNNTVGLLCRYNKDEGWYEFNIANNGSYWIYAYDATSAINKVYNTIASGTSKAVKQGKDINTYGATCIGDKLTLTINGVEVKTVKDVKYKFHEGKVGFSVSSFDVTPIMVNVDSFTISEP
jgi:hypothetical protein